MAKRGDMVAVRTDRESEGTHYGLMVVTSITRAGEPRAVRCAATPTAHVMLVARMTWATFANIGTVDADEIRYVLMARQRNGDRAEYGSVRELVAAIRDVVPSAALAELRTWLDAEEAAEVASKCCEHAVDQDGCARLYCKGVPPASLSIDAGLVTVTETPTPAETGSAAYGRELAMASRALFGDPDATMPEIGATTHYRDGRTRDAQRWQWQAAGRIIRVVSYGENHDHAVYVDGERVAAGFRPRGYARTHAGQVVQLAMWWMQDRGWSRPAVAPAPAVESAPVVDTPAESAPESTPATAESATATLTLPAGGVGESVTLTVPADSVAMVEAAAVHLPYGADYRRAVADNLRRVSDATRKGDLDAARHWLADVEAAMPVAAESDATPAEPTAVEAETPAPVDVAALAVTVDRAELADALAYVGGAIATRPSVPVLGGVRLQAVDGQLHVATFNYDQARTVTLAADVTGTGVVLIPWRTVRDFVKAVPRTVVNVALTADGAAVTLAAGSASATVATLPVEDYPTLPELPPAVGTVGMGELAPAVARVAVAHGRDDTLPMMTGVRLYTDAGRLHMEATDRYRLTFDSVTWQPADGSDAALALVPGALLANVVKSLARFVGKSGDVAIGVAGEQFDGRIGLRFGGYTLHARLLDGGNWPPVRNLLPATIATVARVDAAALAAAVKRVAAMAASKATPVRLQFDAADTVTVAVGGGDEPAASEPVPCQWDGPLGHVAAFNPSYLVDGLKHAGPGEVTLSAPRGDGKPVVIDGQAASYRYLIQPIRVVRDAPEAVKPAVETAPATTPEPAAEAEPAAVDTDEADRIAVCRAVASAVAAGDTARAVSLVIGGPEAAPTAASAPPAAVDTETPAVVDSPAPAGPAVRDLIAAANEGGWDTYNAGTRRAPALLQVLRLGAGRLDRPTFEAARDTLQALGGAWNRNARGFTFEPGHSATGPWDRSRPSGRERVAEWLAATETSAETAPDAAPVVDVAPEPVPDAAAEAAPEHVAQRAWEAFQAGRYADALAAIDQGETLAPDHLVAGGLTWERVRAEVVRARDAGQSAPVVVEQPEPADGGVSAPIAPVSAPPVSDPDGDVVDSVEVPPAPAGMVVAPRRPAEDTPYVVVDGPAVGPVAFTLAPYDAEHGVSYRAARSAVRQALRAAGITASVVKDADARRVFTVDCSAGDRGRVAVIVAASVRLESVRELASVG